MAWSSESAPATSRCSRASRSGYSACCGSSASLGAAPKHSYRHLPRVGGRGGCWCWSRGVPTSGQHQHDDFPAPISDQHPRPAPMFPAPAFREVLFWIHPQTTQRKFRPLRTVPDSRAVGLALATAKQILSVGTQCLTVGKKAPRISAGRLPTDANQKRASAARRARPDAQPPQRLLLIVHERLEGQDDEAHAARLAREQEWQLVQHGLPETRGRVHVPDSRRRQCSTVKPNGWTFSRGPPSVNQTEYSTNRQAEAQATLISRPQAPP